MNFTFLSLLNTSISASWLVLVVIGLRFLLKKAPKAIHCALWALVAIRLLCPFTIESQFSLVPSTETVSDYYLTQEGAFDTAPAVLDVVENPIYPENIDITLDTKSSRISWLDVEWSVIIWPAGMAVMAAYVLVSYLRLWKRVSASIPIAKNIRICDYIDSPFILGLFRPKIYLPSDMTQGTLDHVLAHEMAHLARRDHWWKPLGFALLTIHWFNPLMWLAYILLCRDIELACDEKVIKNLDAAQKKSYSSALLQCSVSRPMIAACPLAFGEVGVKERVRTVLNYKKPAFWIVAIAVIACIVVAVCFLTDPLSPTVDDILHGGDYTILAQCDESLEITIAMDQLPEEIFSHDGCEFEEGAIIVHQSDTSTISLRSVRYADETGTRMSFEFDVRYELPKVGTILLPYRMEDAARTDYVSAHSPMTTEKTSVWDGEPILRGVGEGERFTLDILTSPIRNAEEFISFPVTMNQLTYAKTGMEPELNRGVFSSVVVQDKSFQASGNEVYRIGWGSYQREVFLDPYGAFEQFTADYPEAISRIRQRHDLAPLTPLNYDKYLRLGWQTTATSESLTAECMVVSDFLDIYDNSMIPANEYESTHNGTYQAGDLLAQHAILSSGFGRGDQIFHLFEYRLSVYDLMESELFSSSRLKITSPTRDELFASVRNTMAVWNEDGTGAAPAEMTKDFIPADAEIELWQFYGQNQNPEYTLFFFDGELTWFAENYGDSYVRIWEVAIPMDEDEEKVPSGTYVSQEKVFWAWHSSLYVEGMTMEVENDTVTLDFQGIDVGDGSTFPLKNNWQTECPINETRRESLAELSNIEPSFAIQDLSDCRYLVLDSTHFLVEKNGELYVVSWNHSNVHLEIIDYIFHMVPEAEYDEPNGRIELGYSTMDMDPEDAAIYNYFLGQNDTDSAHTSVSFESYGNSISYQDDLNFITHYLAVRVAHYSQNMDGTIIEESYELLPMKLSMVQKEDGTYEVTDCIRDDADYSASAFSLEAECWRQAYVHFNPDTEAAVAGLITEYPEYFTRDTTYGLDLLWWNTDEGIRCVILSGLQRNRVGSEAGNHPPLTVPEAMVILQSYDIPIQALLAPSSSTLAIYHVDAP